MVVLGICGALLFALTPGWTYSDAVRRGIAPGTAMAMVGTGAVLTAIAAIAGAIVSGWHARGFLMQWPTVSTSLRSVIGGAVMAIGASLIPGGNDSLMLAAVPAATLGGIVAYAIMSVTVPVLLLAERFLLGV